MNDGASGGRSGCIPLKMGGLPYHEWDSRLLWGSDHLTQTCISLGDTILAVLGVTIRLCAYLDGCY